MKINRINKFKNKLLTLKLIKTRTYKNLNFFNSIKIKNIGFKLKKALYVIYKYHINNKQIVFVGTPLKLNKKLKYLLKNAQHVIIPESLWINGSIRNRLLNNSNNAIYKILLKLKRTPDLIVILNKAENNTILEESYKTKILTISLSGCLTKDNYNYTVPGKFRFIKKQIKNNLFYALLIATLKKPIKNMTSIKLL